MNIESSNRSIVDSRYHLGRRRTARMTLNAAVGLSGHDHQRCPFTLPANASSLNRHGAAIQVNRELAVGSTVVVSNKHGVQIAARVIREVCVIEGGTRTYGIEFVEQDEKKTKYFWGISFPTV